MIVVTAAQMRELDRLTIEKYATPSLTLMERAGEGIAAAILQRFARAAKKGVLIVAGKGNNGGDGFVVARLLKKKRIPCEVVLLARREELTADAAHNLRALEQTQRQGYRDRWQQAGVAPATDRQARFVGRCDSRHRHEKRRRRSVR